MSYSRCIKDVEKVCLKFIYEPADKTVEKALNKNITTVLNYYKLMFEDLFVNESISAKITINDSGISNIQLVLSDNLEQEYTKRR